jgi:hypothetical protein
MPEDFAVQQPSPHYKRHRFPGEIISHAVWLYYRFLLSYRDIEELPAERDTTRPRAPAASPAPRRNWVPAPIRLAPAVAARRQKMGAGTHPTAVGRP